MARNICASGFLSELRILAIVRIVESVLWDAVPSYCRKLDHALRSVLGTGLPLNFAPITFASWMGGLSVVDFEKLSDS